MLPIRPPNLTAIDLLGDLCGSPGKLLSFEAKYDRSRETRPDTPGFPPDPHPEIHVKIYSI
jgi:hypothetical protein